MFGCLINFKLLFTVSGGFASVFLRLSCGSNVPSSSCFRMLIGFDGVGRRSAVCLHLSRFSGAALAGLAMADKHVG